MSGPYEDEGTCPKCGKNINGIISDRPYHTWVSGFCLGCGYAYNTVESQIDQDELEELRIDYEWEE